MKLRYFTRLAPRALGSALTYFACAALAIRLTRFEGGVAFVWLAGAILFAQLNVTPRRRRVPVIFGAMVGSFLASFFVGFGGWAALFVSMTTVGEAVAAESLVRRAFPRFGRLESLSEVGRFILVAGLLVPCLTAFTGAASAHYAVGAPFWTNWLDWYAAHALGFVAFAPPAVLAMRGDIRQWMRESDRSKLLEAALILGSVAAASIATFAQNRVPLVAIPFVPMVAATFRLGRFGAVSSIVILMAIGIPCSMLNLGPTTLLQVSMGAKLQVLQLYFAAVVLVLLPVAAELKSRKRLIARLQAAETLHRLILDRAGDVVIRVGLDNFVRFPLRSDAGIDAEGCGFQHAKPLDALVPVDDLESVCRLIERAIASPSEAAIGEFRIIGADGQPVWMECHLRASLDPAGSLLGTVGILREITARRRLIDDLQLKASTDPLTGLGNRRTFSAALSEGIDAGGPETDCLVLFDLDHFKRVNDQFGHSMGDTVLVQFATLLRSAVRDGDVVARIGGEEFAALLRKTTIDQAELACERIRRRLATADVYASDDQIVRITVSAGLVNVGEHLTAASALEAADRALYRAKNEGRDRLVIAA